MEEEFWLRSQLEKMHKAQWSIPFGEELVS